MSNWETTPMTPRDMEWWAEYQKARATIRWEIVDRGNVVPSRPMPSPRMVRELYDGMRLVDPEPEPER